MMGTWSRMFCLNFVRDVSYSWNIDSFSARTACSETTRALAGGSSATTGRMKSGTALPLDSAMTFTSPSRLWREQKHHLLFVRAGWRVSRQVPEHAGHQTEQDGPERHHGGG